MAEQRQYDEDYKVQAVKLAEKNSQSKAADELGISMNPYTVGLEKIDWAISTLERAPRLQKAQ